MSSPQSTPAQNSQVIQTQTITSTIKRNFVSFHLNRNSKLPAKGGEWNKENRYKWKLRSLERLRQKNNPNEGFNFGIPCGLVNKIFVLDMDLYKLKTKSDFISTFGSNYVELFNTLTVKTGSGGEHLYFKFDRDITTTACALHQIDIRSNGSYVVGAGSNIDKKQYTLINDTDIKPCPLELKEWIVNNLYKQTRKITDFIKKDSTGEIINPIDKKDLSYQNEVDLSSYNYDFSDTILRKIFNSLDKSFYENYEDFLVVATCLKTLNKEDYFYELCDTKLDKKHLLPSSSWGIHSEDMYSSCEYKAVNTLPFILRSSEFLYESVDTDICEAYKKYNCVAEYITAKKSYYQFMSEKSKNPKIIMDKDLSDKCYDLIAWEVATNKAIKEFLGYYMYKPTNNHTRKPDTIIKNKRYLIKTETLDTKNVEGFFCGVDDLTVFEIWELKGVRIRQQVCKTCPFEGMVRVH